MDTHVKRLQRVKDQETRAMVDKGWFAHAVHGDPQSPTNFNYHTHGFRKTLGHLDIQIVLPMRETICHDIAGTIFHRIQEGETFKDRDKISEIIANFDVVFIQVREKGRDVLRVILPGKNGETEPIKLKREEEPEYSLQWVV